jgi:hypothetical protein
VCGRRQSHITRSANARLRSVRTCEYCGVEFHRRNPSGQARRGEVKEGRFCSRVCAASAVRVHATKRDAKAANRARKRQREGRQAIGAAPCTECSKPVRQPRLACKGECSRLRSLRLLREQYAKDPEAIERANRLVACKQCGTSFKMVSLRDGRRIVRRKFCSITCANRSMREAQGKNHRKRARYHGVAYEAFRTQDILRRDGYRCMICGIKTPKKLRGSTAPNAPELDHRIPMAMGGGHTRDNVQCACRRCNLAKGGNRVEGQLRLFAA